MKHLLIAVYIFSILYCYLQFNTVINFCIKLFKERHPTLPIEGASWSKEFKLSLEILLISAIPVVNILFGVFISTLDDNTISEIVDNVEMKHWNEIYEIENGLEGKIDWDHYF